MSGVLPSGAMEDLGGGLILRRALPADTDRLAEFNGRIHADDDTPPESISAWTRDLMQGRMPGTSADDFLVVEEPASGKIVSSMNLISDRWSYGGIPFPLGRPELVGTDPEYRFRGLVRKQFDVVHAWCRERGQVVQGITGIPNFYRQYGYEMVLPLDAGRLGYAGTLPKLKEGQAEPYRLRPVTEADLPFLALCYETGCKRGLLASLRSPGEWQFEVFGRSERNINRREFRLIETAEGGEPVGFVCYSSELWGTAIGTMLYELRPGVSWAAVTPSVMRFLWQAGQELARLKNKECLSYYFCMGDSHPSYEVAAARLPRSRRSYAWYVRIPDLKGFISLIRPVLEERLANSYAPGHSGDLTLGFYRSGLRLKFEHGKLETIEDFRHTPVDWPDAAFPDQSFLQLLLGYRTLDELQHAYTDCLVRDDARYILSALFPRRDSDVWPLN